VADEEFNFEVPELTEAEVSAMLASQGLAELAKDEVYMSYIMGALNETIAEAGPVFYEALRQSLTGIADPAKLEAAKNLLARDAKTWVTRMAETEIKKIGEVVAAGIEEGLHPFAIAKRLDMVTGLDSVRAKTYANYISYLDSLDPALSKADWEKRAEAMYQKLLKDRKEVIAQTEARYATASGNDAVARATGKRWKVWITAGDGRVSDPCRSNEAKGWIGIDDKFPSGQDMPPQHPRCRCSLAYREADPDRFAEERAEERSAKTAAAIAVGA